MSTDDHRVSDPAPAAPTAPVPSLEIVGDPDVGACVDGTCEVPLLAVDEPAARPLDARH